MKFNFDNVYGHCHSLIDDITRGTGVMIGQKRVLVCRYCDVGEGCTFDSGARVFIGRLRPQAAVIESVVS